MIKVAQVRFFKSRAGKRIAYADEGEGPLVLLPAWWVSHLERDAEDPAYRKFFGRLVSAFRVVRYDRVGVGMSDRARRNFTLASELADFTDLVEHLAVPRFHLLGFSCAGPVALAYAAENPECVDRIVLYASYLWGASLSPTKVKEALIALVRAHGRLGSRTLADIFYPTADGETRKRFNAVQRDSAEPETAARLLELTYALDARPFAPRVRAPVLVLHRAGDNAIPYEEARRLAASLEDATLCTLPGRSHMPWHEDGDSVIDPISAFLNARSARTDRSAPDTSAELRREGEVWRLRFDGRQSLLRSSKGLVDLARLLGRPGEDIHVLDLVGAYGSERRDARRVDLALDSRALQSYRRRLVELDNELAEAEASADLGRTSKLKAEREALLHQLAADTGRQGRSRHLNDPVERARKAVAARLRDAIGRVKVVDRAAGVSLGAVDPHGRALRLSTDAHRALDGLARSSLAACAFASGACCYMKLTNEQYRKVMRKGWNLTPEIYDRVWTPVLREYSVGCIERARVRPGDRVIDVATGPGTAALLASDRVGNGGSVLGVDISDRFVEVATAAASARANVRFERHPMEQIGVPDRSYDAATCVLGLMFAAPVELAVTEIARVLTPGGRFAACVWGRRERCAFREMFSILGQQLQMDVCPLFFALGVPGAFARVLEGAGFIEAREERVETLLRWRDNEEACAAVFDGGAGALPFSMFDDEQKRQVCVEFIASIERYRRGGPFEAPVEFVYATARLPSADK